MPLVLPREEEVENIFSRILASDSACERLYETFYNHISDDNRESDIDVHHFVEVLLNAYKNGDVSALLLELCNRSMFDLLKESYLIPKRFHGKAGENPICSLIRMENCLMIKKMWSISMNTKSFVKYMSIIMRHHAQRYIWQMDMTLSDIIRMA